MSGAGDPLTLMQAIELATAHLQAGRLREAEALFRRVLDADPGNLSLLDTLGRITHECGDYDQALDYFNRAIRLHPNDPGVRFNRGVALEAQGCLAEAEAAYREALSCNPGLAMAHGNLGVVLHKQGRDGEAVACFVRSLELNPADPKTCNNLGLARRRLGEPQQALADFQRALQWAPDYAEAHNNLGAVLYDLGRAAEAEACYRQALRLKPDLSRARWNLAAPLLLRGEFEEGLALYEDRFTGGDEAEFIRPRQLIAELAAVPRWSGEPLQGRRLLIWAEQGAGDAIMMLRYLPRLAAKGAGAVIVSCRAGLRRLIATLPAVTRAMEDGDPLPLDAVDCHCPVMSLPHVFGTRLETIPGGVPYLVVPPGLAQRWRQRLAPLPGLKVGLAWAGNPSLRDDRLRSIAFERLAPLLAVPGAQFISLQKEGGVGHAALHDWMAECEDFLDTAALIEQLDLVISVDTAVAHLAGALAKPIWLLNRTPGEWRWMEGREDSPWYPTLRIFRQPCRGDWDSVIANVAAELRARHPGA